LLLALIPSARLNAAEDAFIPADDILYVGLTLNVKHKKLGITIFLPFL
jgi:hypothetical protein